ncbi:PBECR4 domain-containing protein [Streptococcus suis]|uniref:PBECR4 domain-containing protein n=1 Tax=Streptococcus suis TaxID=1307 RepID=UPI0028C48BA8|nr:PBECR4 domain-containing protein [Streptococcus suis]WNO83047.1 PBECR4 domain-containing protein [Streptococcus suis]
MASVKELRQVNIVGVAESLGMALEPKGSGYYEWKEHDSLVINVRKNRFNWFSRDLSGDPIALVQAVREDQTGQPVSFKEAKHYVETGSFPTVDTIDYTRKEFSNYLSRYESKDKTLMLDYLKNERGLSEETIRFFDEKGVLGQANYKNAQGIEPVILFKTLDAKGKMIGGSLQGIVENRELYDRGRLKQIMKHSDGSSGFNVDIGSPKRLIVAEAPIDLMSYYELHKGELNDVRLVAMDGLKEGTISRHYMEILHLKRGKVYEVDHKKTPQALSNIAKTSTHFKQEENQSVITLALDNDSAGRRFLSRLEDKGIRFVSDLPPLPAGKEKSDWNDYLKQKKKESNMEIVKENSTIDQSQEKEIASYIESITAEEHGFYLWYDEELKNLGASDEVIEAFHEALPEKTYTINGIQLFVEESSNDGATGYLSLDGNVLDRDGIEDYLANSELTYDQKTSFLQSLEDRLPAIWDEVVQSYEKVYKEMVSRFQLDKKAEADYHVRLHRSMHPSLSQLGDGAVIPYKQLVETLYPENKRLLEERASQIAEALASAGSDLQQLTTFDLIDPDGAIVERNITYDAGDELETIAEKNKTAPYGADLLAIDREVSERLGISHDFKQQKKDETKLGDFPVKQEAAPLPEATNSQPLNDLSPNQTRSQPLLHFTIRDDAKSIHKDYYHPATQKEIAKLNRYTPTIQQTAQWYLDKVADSRIIYLYQDGDSISSLAVQFDRDKFMHLTGIYPYQEGQTAEQTLLDFANGKGDFDTILLANKGATFDKVKVLPELEAIVESDSFYFGDLSEVPKLKRLDLDKAIRSGDEDVLLAMRTVDGTTFPASLMKLRQSLKLQLDSTNQERSVLGVYRYRDNQLDQLSINEELIKDEGESFKSILDQVVENLNQADQTDKTIDEDMVYQDQPLLQHQLEPDKQEEAKPELVDSTFYTQTSNQNKLSELLASKDRAGLAQHLKEGVHQYLNSEQYKDFLNTMSRFPNYSYRNIQLLKAQMPTVQAVASFKSWKEDFGRTVIKGSKSLRIFAPQITKLRDPQTGEVLKDEQGNDKTRITFKLVPVFDISQTEGKELPKPIYQLEGNHENYSKLYRSAKAYAQSKGLTMEFNSNIGEANGYYSRKENKIVIKAGMSEQQTLKTIYHELAHADLHSSQTVAKDLQYSDAELQAESVAYVVANHYGLDTSEYSFGYLATWVRDKEALSDLEAQLEIVQKEAQHLINSLDRELEKQLEQAQVQTVEKVEPVEKLSFEERLARAEQESKLLAEEQGKEEEQAKKQEAKQSIQER